MDGQARLNRRRARRAHYKAAITGHGSRTISQ
jgi:hypothetical protein